MNRKIKIAVTAAVAVIVLIIIGVACVPSIVRSIENGYAKKCYKNAFRLLNVLEENLNSDEVNQTWYELIAEGNSVKLLGALKEELGDDSIDVSNYYVKFGNESVSILCKKHPEMQDVTKSIPNNLVTYDVEFEPPQSDIITRIYATGKDLYFQNVGLDRSDPTKLKFSNSDDMSGLFKDIRVVAEFAGGGARYLRADEYNILVGNLDFAKTGVKPLRIVYTGRVFPSNLMTTFNILVIKNSTRQQLVVDCYGYGRYELASWDWTNYVSDALDANGDYMEFDASIVCDDGSFYYFPDGFVIEKTNRANKSIDGALDIDDKTKKAYRIRFDLNDDVLTDKMQTEIVHEGCLKFDDGNFYIWQEHKSKEAPEGWLRVYCELRRLTEADEEDGKKNK